MNELGNVQVSELEATNLLNQANEVDSSELDKLKSSGFIPNLSIAYATSDTLKKGIASLGEFVLGGETSLGKEIEIVPLAYRLRVSLMQGTRDFVESDYVMMNQQPSENFRNMCVMNPPPGHKILRGSDIFIYIPKISSFACFTMISKTLSKFVSNIWANGKGGRLVVISTQMQTSKKGNTWFDIITKKTNQSLVISNVEGTSKNIEMDLDTYKEFYRQFSNPYREATETVNENEKSIDTIER